MNDITCCPACERRLRIPETLEGHDVKCPACGKVFAPDREPEAAAVPVPAEETLEEAEEPARKRKPRRDEEPRRPRRRPRRDEYEEEEDEYNRPCRLRYEPHRGELILILGVCSIVFFGIVLGPLAWVLGSSDLAAMRARRMDPGGESMTQTGRILGMVVTILHLVLFLGGCLFFGLMMMAGAASGLR